MCFLLVGKRSLGEEHKNGNDRPITGTHIRYSSAAQAYISDRPLPRRSTEYSKRKMFRA